jgi:hypothetical protein
MKFTGHNLRLLLASRHVLRTVTFAGLDRWSTWGRTFNQSPTPDKTSVDSRRQKLRNVMCNASKNEKMKKILFILSFTLTSMCSFSQTNLYCPFPENNVIWCDSFGFDGNPTSACGVSSITITGDTIIDSAIYHKLFKSEFYYQSGVNYHCSTNNPLVFWSGYKGAIRQDTIQRKVFYREPNSTTDSLLYDFSLNVGDTIKSYIKILCPDSPTVVTSIDSVLIGTHYRKRWTVNQYFCISNAQIIEGIGSASGLLEPFINTGVGGQTTYKLYCFSQNNQTLYPYYSLTSGCSLITSIQEQTSNDLISISPNPSSGQFTIETNSTDKKNIDLFNINGKHVFSDIISEKAIIDMTNLNEGIYILVIKTTTYISYRKIVLVR